MQRHVSYFELIGAYSGWLGTALVSTILFVVRSNDA